MNFTFAEYPQVFKPHEFDVREDHIDMYHVYDNLSRTPFQHGIGIECGDPDNYLVYPEHVITAQAMRNHLDWNNREDTQFISFYSSLGAASIEQRRRQRQHFVAGVGYREADSVQIAHVRLSRDSNVWLFSRAEMLGMMKKVTWPMAVHNLWLTSGAQEWFVWWNVPEQFVQNRAHLRGIWRR
nr:hypothetical protein CFP56_31513 [Quercus suber]